MLQSGSELTRSAQLRIIGLFLQGCSFCEIVRRTGYARQTVTKVCRSEDVQGALRETKAIILGESGAWAESINYAVTHEKDGKLSYRLLKDFGAIPSLENNSQPKRLNEWENVDPETLAKARVLGMEALRRASVPLEGDELEKLARKD